MYFHLQHADRAVGCSGLYCLIGQLDAVVYIAGQLYSKNEE